jgi:hypothetical protein
MKRQSRTTIKRDDSRTVVISRQRVAVTNLFDEKRVYKYRLKLFNVSLSVCAHEMYNMNKTKIVPSATLATLKKKAYSIYRKSA